MILEYYVKENNKTINQIINEEFELSNRLFNKLLNLNKIYLNNNKVDTRKMASVGDKITLDLNYEEDNSNILPIEMNLNILYEDEGLLILNKPSGIAVHPSMLHFNDSLSNGVKFYFDKINLHKKIRPVNRLDLGTSGIIIFAKNEYIQENLIRQMANGTFSKEYIAVVNGSFENKTGIIDAPIARIENSIIERCISSNGKKAITEYEVLDELNLNKTIYSIVKCKLHTGRTHQIRVHMAYINHPIVGDSLYGNIQKSSNFLLCSCYVSFIHPITKKKFELSLSLKGDRHSLASACPL